MKVIDERVKEKNKKKKKMSKKFYFGAECRGKGGADTTLSRDIGDCFLLLHVTRGSVCRIKTCCIYNWSTAYTGLHTTTQEYTELYPILHIVLFDTPYLSCLLTIYSYIHMTIIVGSKLLVQEGEPSGPLKLNTDLIGGN